jgi:predicted ATPase
MRELRQALGDDARKPRFIETVHRRGYRFIGHLPTVHPSAPHAASAAPPPLLVGRVQELDALQRGLATALTGVRQILFVTGEAGRGKTTLVDTFLAAVAEQGPLWIGRGQCLEHYGAGEAYLPVLEALERLCRGPGGMEIVEILRQQAPTWLAQMPGLVSPVEREGLQRRVLGTTQERMLRELAEALNVLTAARPLVLVLEDLHWSDYATLDALAVLARRREPARLLLLGTYRPPDALQQGHPLQTVQHELHMHGQCAELPLTLFPEAAVADYLAARFPDAQLPAGLAHLVHQRTEGNPLFMVQVVEDWVRRGWLAQVDRHWTLRVGLAALAVTVPEGLRQMLEQYLDRLSPMEQQVLEVGSVAGITFSAAAVAAGLVHEVVQVEECCAGLARRRQWLEACGEHSWPDETVAGAYRFTHALYQEVAYTRLTAARRAQAHRRIGEREEVGYGPQAHERAAVLAVHFERGRDADRAIRYLQHAADNALGRFAYTNAITHLTKALALLVALPDTPERAQRELDVQLALGPAFMATKGLAAPAVEQTYTRARTLCAQIGKTPQVFSALRGLAVFYHNRGALPTARELREQCLRLAQQAAEPMHLLEAHIDLGITLSYLGEYAAARTHFEQGITRTDPLMQRVLRRSVVPGVVCLAHAARTLWCLGDPAQALQRSQEALALAQELAHHHSLAYALHFATLLHYLRRDTAAVQAEADVCLALATAQGFPLWEGAGLVYRGWALAMQGEWEVGLAQLRQGLAAAVALEQELSRPSYLVLFAEAAGHVGQIEEGLCRLAEALTAFEATGRGDLLAEAYRLQGTLLLRQDVPDAAQAENCFQQALAIARRQQAKSWELRTATSLSRLWQQQGKQAEARALLTPIYGWFTEGFDTADLQEAKALLRNLEG